LLVDHVGIHRQKYVEISFGFRQKRAVPEARPAKTRHRCHRVIWQISTQPPIQILVEQGSHSDWLRQLFAKLLQHRNHLFPLYTREAYTEVIDRLSGLQMVEEALRRHARPHEKTGVPPRISGSE
jgi:hypothetical protein